MEAPITTAVSSSSSSTEDAVPKRKGPVTLLSFFKRVNGATPKTDNNVTAENTAPTEAVDKVKEPAPTIPQPKQDAIEEQKENHPQGTPSPTPVVEEPTTQEPKPQEPKQTLQLREPLSSFKKPRTQSKKPVKARKPKGECHLYKLPPELLSEIFSYIAPKDLFKNCFTVNSLFYSALNPNGPEGQHTWRLARIRMGFPDPVLIGLSDYQFLERFYGKACDFCPKQKIIEKTDWIIHPGSVRACGKCFDKRVRSYSLMNPSPFGKTQPSQFIHLPYTVERYYTGEIKLAKVWIADILKQPPTNEEIEKMLKRREELFAFRDQVEAVEERLKIETFQAEQKLLDERRKQMFEFVDAKFPELQDISFFWDDVPSFATALKVPAPLTEQSKRNLLKKIQADLETPELLRSCGGWYFHGQARFWQDVFDSQSFRDKCRSLADASREDRFTSYQQFVDVTRQYRRIRDIAEKKLIEELDRLDYVVTGDLQSIANNSFSKQRLMNKLADKVIDAEQEEMMQTLMDFVVRQVPNSEDKEKNRKRWLYVYGDKAWEKELKSLENDLLNKPMFRNAPVDKELEFRRQVLLREVPKRRRKAWFEKYDVGSIKFNLDAYKKEIDAYIKKNEEDKFAALIAELKEKQRLVQETVWKRLQETAPPELMDEIMSKRDIADVVECTECNRCNIFKIDRGDVVDHFCRPTDKRTCTVDNVRFSRKGWYKLAVKLRWWNECVAKVKLPVGYSETVLEKGKKRILEFASSGQPEDSFKHTVERFLECDLLFDTGIERIQEKHGENYLRRSYWQNKIRFMRCSIAVVYENEMGRRWSYASDREYVERCKTEINVPNEIPLEYDPAGYISKPLALFEEKKKEEDEMMVVLKKVLSEDVLSRADAGEPVLFCSNCRWGCKYGVNLDSLMTHCYSGGHLEGYGCSMEHAREFSEEAVVESILAASY